MEINRRRFLAGSSLLTLGALPPVVYRTTLAGDGAGSPTDGRILVVIQMSGGNDGINTVVPFADEGYARHRDQLRLPTDRLLKIDDSSGLHPAMRGASDLLEDGRLAIVQGVGYPNPSRSHDTSMAIWHSGKIGDDDTLRTHGWIGKAMDEAQAKWTRRAETDAPQMILVGDESQPLAIQSRRSTAIAMSNLSDLQLAHPVPIRARRATDDLTAYVEQTSKNASVTAHLLSQVLDDNRATDADYPSTQLAERLKSVSTLIQCGFSTPVYYTIQDGYDTHAAQLPSHSRLLREFSDAIKAFLDDLTAAGLSDRVVVMGFSEFGRRVAENASEGTDHGTAGPMFLAGDKVRGGLVGESPSLTDLVDGDLKMNIDFRDVYRDVVNGWLGIEASSKERRSPQSLQLFDT